jgi:Permuted papain-like amidase enzyme, YaeF/YiiX, C92 family
MKKRKPLLTETERAALQSGDIVFISEPYPVCHLIAATCESWDSHVGILFRDPDGRLRVAESRVPCCAWTTLDKFLSRTSAGKFAIRRLNGGVSKSQANLLRFECNRRMGRPYHQGFNFDSSREFCSKFVYGVYRDALGIEVGKLETFHELLSRNPRAPVGWWRLWFLGFIPWKRRTVTPTSQLRSPRLSTVLSHAV